MPKLPAHLLSRSATDGIRSDVELYLRPRTPEENAEALRALCQFGVDVWNSLPHRQDLREFEDPRTAWYTQVVARHWKAA